MVLRKIPGLAVIPAPAGMDSLDGLIPDLSELKKTGIPA